MAYEKVNFKSRQDEMGITFRSNQIYMNAGLQKKIGAKRFNVLVDNSEYKLCLQFDTFGDRTTKTPDIPITPFIKSCAWIKTLNGKFIVPNSISKEHIEFILKDKIIDFPIEKETLKPLVDNKKEYTPKELCEIFECSITHFKRRIKEVGIIPKYKIGENNLAIGIIRGCDINAGLELNPDLFTKRR